MNNTTESRYMVNIGEQAFMSGDRTSVSVLYNNLTGTSFQNAPGWLGGHGDYIKMMQSLYGCPSLLGETISMVDPMGNVMQSCKFGERVVKTLAELNAMDLDEVADLYQQELAGRVAVEIQGLDRDALKDDWDEVNALSTEDHHVILKKGFVGFNKRTDLDCYLSVRGAMGASAESLNTDDNSPVVSR